EGLTSINEVNDKIEEILPQNAWQTRNKIRGALKKRYLTFNEDLLIRTPLLKLVSKSRDLTFIKELLCYHYLNAERIGAEVVQNILYPRLPRASYDEAYIINYLTQKMHGASEKTIKNTCSLLKTALKRFGLLTKIDDNWFACPYSPKLETFIYVLYHEFTVTQNYLNPKTSYLLEKAEFPRIFLMHPTSMKDYIQRARLTKLISYETYAGEEQVALIHKSLDRAANEMIKRMEGK
ncbi:unnamed protein product, partial [marine sediment metagenome]